jgi:hypothetical protein
MGIEEPPPPQGFGRGNLREKDHLEGPGRDRLKDNIKMPAQELVVYGSVDWVDLAQDGGTSSNERGTEPTGSVKCGEYFE